MNYCRIAFKEESAGRYTVLSRTFGAPEEATRAISVYQMQDEGSGGPRIEYIIVNCYNEDGRV